MVHHDFYCPECGNESRDWLYHDQKGQERIPVCVHADGHRVEMQIHYGRIKFSDMHSPQLYGKPVMAFGGRVVESYGHKQQILHELGLKEASDPVGGSHDWDRPGPVEPKKPDPLMQFATWNLSEIPKIEEKINEAVYRGEADKLGIPTVHPDQLTESYTNRVFHNIERGRDPEAD